jgi:RHS repeat-associated protein
LTLFSEPLQYIPGDPLNLAWELFNLPEEQAGFQIELLAPPAFSPAGELARSFDPAARSLALAADSQAQAVAWNVPPDAEGEYAFQASLLLEGKRVYSTTLRLQEDGFNRVPAEGGEAVGFNDQVRVHFPKGAVEEDLTVRVRHPSLSARPPQSLSGQPFEIQAIGQKSGEEVHKFAQPLTIEVSYAGYELFEQNEAWLRLYYYDEAQAEWLPLPSQVFTDSQVLRASTDHLTVFDISSSTWESGRLPSLQAFQVSQFTGAASYSLPLWTPPGPGGLQPSLELSYSSQAVDNAIAAQTQASFVGMGWALDTGSIERDQHGTPDYMGDDTFSISAAGVSSLLLKGEDGYYHTAGETFWRIQYDSANDTWNAWDKSGTQYIFGATAATRALYPSGYHYSCNGNYTTNPTTWRWSLYKMRNIHQQELTFTYFTDYQNKKHPCDSNIIFNTAIAVYPQSIEYPHGQYRVVFDLESRSDYKNAWTNTGDLNFYMKYRLDALRIENNGVTIRKYDFVYANTAVIFPNHSWQTNVYTLALQELKEYGANNDASLPATSFTYGDGLHLTQVDNGYGGQVSYDYEAEPWHESLGTPQGKQYKLVTDCEWVSSSKSWEPNNMKGYNGGSAACERIDEDTVRLKIKGQAYMELPASLVQPGAAYHVGVQLSTRSGNVTEAQIGINDGVTSPVPILATQTSMQPWHTYSLSGMMVVPKNATRVWLHVYCNNGAYCYLNDRSINLHPTRYRVTGKTSLDTHTNESITYSYSYDNPATNTALNSYAVYTSTSTTRYVPAYAEFRGHSMVREQAPGGLVTTSFFHQDDAKKGQSSLSLVGTQSYYQPFTSTLWSDYTNAWNYWTTLPAFERQDGDLAAKVTYSGGGWQGMLHRTTYSLTSGKTALVQFRVAKDAQNRQEAVFGLESGAVNSNYQSWRVHLKQDGRLFSTYCTTTNNVTTCPDSLELYSYNQFKLDTWYVLALIADNSNGFYLRVWPRDDPGSAKNDRRSFSSTSWRFAGFVNYGTMWLDEYSEGVLYSLSETVYDADSDAPVQVDANALPKTKANPYKGIVSEPYDELKISWTRPVQAISYTFEGSSRWLGVRNVYEYLASDQGGTQYGNQTRSYQEEWNDSTGAWQRYRATITGYYPPAGGNPYLVGLPGYTESHSCSGAPCSNPSNADLLSLRYYLYDDQQYSSQPPINGILTGERELLRFAGAYYNDPRYRDVRYAYDSYGNRTTTSSWSGEGTYSACASAGGRTETSTYETTYNTYAVQQTSALGFVTTLTYDYRFGLPLSEIDASGTATTAAYDNFGRISEVRRPGDESGTATQTFIYSDSASPTYTEATQKIDENTTYRIRKYYDGLGQLLQTQVMGAVIGASTRDIKVDYYYTNGRVTGQSMPYDVAPGGGFGRSGAYLTQTAYDALGRTATITAPDTTVTAYSYALLVDQGKGYQVTCVTNARGNQSCTRSDAWGRTVRVTPPSGQGPELVYTFDESDRMTGVTQAGSVNTYLTFDLAGRKTEMNDPDMGVWKYGYDALGGMTLQDDARGKRVCFYYDLASRLLGKYYTTSGTSCPASPTYNASYSYDGILRSDNFDGTSLPSGWASSGSVTFSGGQAHITGNNTWSTNLRRSADGIKDSLAARVTFKVSSASAVSVLHLEDGPWGQPDYRRWGLSVDGGWLKRVRYTGTASTAVDLMPVETNTWYEVVLAADGYGGMRLTVWEKDDPSQMEQLVESAGEGWMNREWNFLVHVYSGVLDVDGYRELDDGGLGQRTGMSDVSGSTAWRYDARGSLAREEKTVTGVGAFTTLWTYNAAGMASAMYYPGGDNGQIGERVQYRYYPQNLIQDTLGSDSGSSYYYLQQAQYDAAGRTDLLKLGATSLIVNSVLLRDYRYHDWYRPNGQGRLMWIKSGAYANPTSLQDLRFYTGSDASPSPSYDAVGNILGIYDHKAGSPQTQSFGYDDLDRLTSAQATGGTIGLHGVYNQETYGYDSLGRLTGLPSLGTYTYNPSVSCAAGNRTLPHAVASAGNNSYAYDCNGNMTTRALGGNNTFNFTYDTENRLTGVSGAATNSYFYDGDSKRVKEVTYENLASGIPLTSGTTLYFAESGTDGDTYPNSGVGTSGEFAYTASGGNQYAQLDLGALYSVDKIKVWHYFVDGRSYHGVKLQVSANGSTWTTIYDSAVQGEYVETSAGKTHTFSAQNVRYVREYLNGSTANTGNHWVEIEVFGSRTNVMIGDYFEWNENSGTMVKYYYAGSERIAMREGTGTLTTGLKWLLGDHLGSTSLSAQGSDGAKLSELRYKPFGELRFAWGTTTTSLRYTGQRAEGTGLYDFKARFYDASLGRFIQPDTMIPAGQGVIGFDRYAYSNNNPVRFNDPTGHLIPWPKNLFENIYIPIPSGLEVLAVAACFVACGVLPVHLEQSAPGYMGFAGDDDLWDSNLLITVAGVELSPEASAPTRPDLYRGGDKDNPNFGLKTPDNPYGDGSYDIAPDQYGNVGPGSGGLSTRSESKPHWKNTWQYPSSAPNPDGVRIFQDTPEDPSHWLWEPAREMPFTQFKRYLQETKKNWIPLK